MKPRAGRYFFELSSVMVFYTAALIAANVLDTNNWSQFAQAGIWALPALAAILVVPVVLRFVGTLDEFQRRVVAESALVSMVVVGLATFAYAFIEEPLGLPQIGLIWVWPALMGVAGVAQIPVRMRLA